MTQLAPSLRKVAVLISALDEQAADALLEQMGPDEAAKVRRALVELDDIPAEEQEQVLADFVRRQRPEPSQSVQDAVSLDIDPEVEAAAASWTPTAVATKPVSEDTASLDFLQDVEALSIARLLVHEHPQTAAVVISHLPPRHAALVLEALPAGVAMEALERSATIDTIAPDILADLARELRRQLAPHVRSNASAAMPLTHLTAVLEAMDYRQRQRLLLQLNERNTALLRRLGLYPSGVSAGAAKAPPGAPRYRLDAVVDELEERSPTPDDRYEPTRTSLGFALPETAWNEQ